jgi:ABC-type glycerol-3-phosphate transport system substrate-binding protein
MHEGFLKEYQRRYPGVNVIPAAYEYAVDTFVPLAESGQLPTVFTTWFTEPPKLINGGFVRDISPELKALGWDAKMNPAIRELLTRDGKIYGFPMHSYALGLQINAALFREAGLVDANGVPRYPKTWDELAQTAVTIKQKTGSAGFVLLAKDNAGGWHFTQIAWGFGASFVVERNGRRIAQVNSPEAAAAMQWVKDLKWKYDVLTPDPTNEDWGTGFRAIGTGAAAMYIGANDAVSQPTRQNGLPVGDLALVPVPAGPRGQYSLMGGTPFMFASNASPEEVNAAIRYIEIMGYAPEVNETTVAGLRANSRNTRDEGTPVIRSFPVWTDPAYLKAQDDAINEFKNVDERFYADYYAMVAKPGNLRPEEPAAQDLYSELTKVLQAVVTDRNANVQALLDTAQRNFQRLLDAAQ